MQTQIESLALSFVHHCRSLSALPFKPAEWLSDGTLSWSFIYRALSVFNFSLPILIHRSTIPTTAEKIIACNISSKRQRIFTCDWNIVFHSHPHPSPSEWSSRSSPIVWRQIAVLGCIYLAISSLLFLLCWSSSSSSYRRHCTKLNFPDQPIMCWEDECLEWTPFA